MYYIYLCIYIYLTNHRTSETIEDTEHTDQSYQIYEISEFMNLFKICHGLCFLGVDTKKGYYDHTVDEGNSANEVAGHSSYVVIQFIFQSLLFTAK